jgi:hypothetical protein
MIGDSEPRHTEAVIRWPLTEEHLNRHPVDSLGLAVEEMTPIQATFQYFSGLLLVLFHKVPYITDALILVPDRVITSNN